MDSSIILRNLTTGYKGKPVTGNINATLSPGELTCLLGPNGAGKSTLLKTLSAFIPPLEGEILVDGTRISDISARQLARIIGVVLTERPATMNMTVEELVSLGRTPYTSFMGGLKEDDRRIAANAMEAVGITALAHRDVHTLSDGERQKAFIAKALAQQTQIILLDEPTAFLDYPSKVEMMKLLLDIARRERKTIFLSTHDVEIAMQTADKLWLLDKEKGLEIGIPEDLAYNGSLERYFSSNDLTFNPQEGNFNISHTQHGSVTLLGNGRLHGMTRKALHRVGISTDGGTRTVEIRTTPNGDETIYLDTTPLPDIATLLRQLLEE